MRVLYTIIAIIFMFSGTFTFAADSTKIATVKGTDVIQYLSADEIVKLFPGKVISFTSGGRDIQTWYSKDGTYEGIRDYSYSFEGNWSVKRNPDRYCFSGRYNERCSRVSYDGVDKLILHGKRGKITATIKVAK